MRWRPLLLATCLLSGLWSGETIRVAVDEWSTLNPLLMARDTDGEAVDLLFDRLVTLDAQGQFIPELLESWTVLDGGRDIILKLRPGMQWHDGRPIEAEDVVFTWKALRLPRVRQIADTAGGVTSLDSLVAEGPLTVRIRLAKPRGSLLSDLYNLIPVPRHLYQVPQKPAQAAVNFHPVGSGPYRLVGTASAKRLVLERWSGYRGNHPGQAPGFELGEAPDEKTYLAEFQRDRLHYASVGALRYYLVRKGAQGAGLVQAHSVPQASFSALFLNCDPRRSLLGDVVVRQALAELIPWQDMARGRRFFPSRLATSFWPPESWAHDPSPRPLPSLARAEALLESTGWHLGPDGVRRNAKGRPLVLKALESTPERPRSTARLVATQAAKVGIRIEVKSIPFEELTALSARHEGDIWSMGWTLALDPDVDSPLFTKDGFKTHANMSSYLNPEVDRLFDQGRHTQNPLTRQEIYHRLSEIIYDDKPVIPVNYAQIRVLSHRRLQGVAFNVLGQSFGFWPGRRGWRLNP